MRWKIEIDCGIGLSLGSGSRRARIGFGFRRRRIFRRIDPELPFEGELHKLCTFFCFIRSGAFAWSCGSVRGLSAPRLDPERGMKRANVINLLFNIMPAPQQPVTSPPPPDHWSFLDHVDAPQWVDLAKEAALMGTQGDDPWFYRSHAHHELLGADKVFSVVFGRHHETSLARVGTAAVAIASTSLREKVKSAPVKKKVALGKSKPACLGGMKRISIVGLKEDRLSSRPRLDVSGSWARTPVKRLHAKGTPRRLLAAGSDNRLAVPASSSIPEIRKESDEATTGSGDCPPADVVKLLKTYEGTRRSVRSSDEQSARGANVGGAGVPSRNWVSDQSHNVCDSPKTTHEASSSPAYRSSGTCDLRVKSSPSSDMTISSDGSPTPSSSSAEAERPVRTASTPRASMIKTQVSKNGVREIRGSPSHLRKPSLEKIGTVPAAESKDPSHAVFAKMELGQSKGQFQGKSLKGLNRDFPGGDGNLSGKSYPDSGHQSMTPTSTPASTPRLKRKSLGNAAKQDELASKKSGSSTSHLQDVHLPDKLYGAQSTHPILEKLRKSWGSALRVKQRLQAESVGSRIETSGCAEDQGRVAAASGDASESFLTDREVNFVDTMLNRNLSLQKPADQTRVQAAAELRVDHAEDEVPQTSVNETSPRSECSTTVQITEPARRVKGSGTPLTKLSKSKSMGFRESRNVVRVSTTTGKTGTGLAQQQKIKPAPSPASAAVSSKLNKKPCDHKDLLGEISLPMKGNKENLRLELGIKAHSTSVDSNLSLDRKKKLQSPVMRTSMPASTKQLHQPLNATRIPHQARTSPASKTGVGSRSRSLGRDMSNASARGSEALVRKFIQMAAAKTTDPIDRKSSNVAVLRGSTSSVPTITKQKSGRLDKSADGSMDKSSDKSSHSSSKDYTSAVPKASKSSSLPDETAAFSTEGDRKMTSSKERLLLKYEPRLHPVKVIREWESRSGKRYYDLQPAERQKVNQEITASKEIPVSKRGSA